MDAREQAKPTTRREEDAWELLVCCGGGLFVVVVVVVVVPVVFCWFFSDMESFGAFEGLCFVRYTGVVLLASFVPVLEEEDLMGILDRGVVCV